MSVGSSTVATVASRRVTDQDAAEAITALERFSKANVPRDDAEDLSQRILERTLATFDRAPPDTTFTGWALGCGQNVLLEFRTQGAKGEIATGLPVELASTAFVSGRPGGAAAPAGFDRLPSGRLERGYDRIDKAIRGAPDPHVPIEATDVEAIEGVASLVFGLLHRIEAKYETGSEYSVHEKSTTASHLAKIHRAYVAAFGYSAKDERWVLFAHDLQIAVERVMLDDHDELRDLTPIAVRAELGRLPKWVEPWLTDDVLTDLLDQSTLTRGGRGKKGSVIANTVPAVINAARADLKLAPLPKEVLVFFRPLKGLKKKTRPSPAR